MAERKSARKAPRKRAEASPEEAQAREAEQKEGDAREPSDAAAPRGDAIRGEAPWELHHVNPDGTAVEVNTDTGDYRTIELDIEEATEVLLAAGSNPEGTPEERLAGVAGTRDEVRHSIERARGTG